MTETDQAVEAFIKESIAAKYPQFKFIGEESFAGGERVDLTDEPTFIVDPIDGTTNFVRRIVANMKPVRVQLTLLSPAGPRNRLCAHALFFRTYYHALLTHPVAGLLQHRFHLQARAGHRVRPSVSIAFPHTA